MVIWAGLSTVSAYIVGIAGGLVAGFYRGMTDRVLSFIAAGTAYSTLGVPTIPFFIYYSMFGFQRIGDLIWAAGDLRCCR